LKGLLETKDTKVFQELLESSKTVAMDPRETQESLESQAG